ncbi:2-hydroxyacid dehydrogenase [Salinimicrobium sp. GXAS 041]|uniref:2-hydroxyacid dehydrogenase n=1 Tax=Salinimicrobium sp. GXAS 041 TaxID=3400806 RepID=UPI003C78F3AA
MIILHADSNHPTLMKQLEDAGHHNIEAYNQSPEEILENQYLYDGIVIRSRFKIGKDFLDAAPNLKFIARVGAGLESIDVDYAEKRGIMLFSAPEGNRNAVGEHALGMLLSLFNKLNQADRQVREGFWYREANRGVELEGKTVGIIGYGNMGKAFAKKLCGFDVEVLCYDIKENIGDENARQVSLQELQKKTDVLSLHTPRTSETNKMINEDFINSFKKPFWFLNTARGKSVVTADLVTALQNKKILGAGLDVLEYEKSSFENLFSEEELPEALQELLLMKNVILSPHVAGWTIESHQKLANTIAEKIIKAFGSADLSNQK